MAYNSKSILVDKDGKPIPQYFNTAGDKYESLEGTGGAAKNIICGPDGNPINVASNKLAVRASEVETALGSILAKLSSDPATQTTLAAILAKLIAAPATEAKQDTLAGLIGEKQATPTENTLLARVKALEDELASLNGKIDDILSGDTPASVQTLGAIPEYNWFAGEERPTPKEPTLPAIGIEVDADTGDMVGLLWNGEDWEEV